MKKKLFFLLCLFPIICLANDNEACLLRFPSVGGDKIVFTYAGDLYVTSINGGVANKITSNVGFETFAKLSPDGKTVVFTGQYDGNTELYSIPSQGGEPKRLTYSATLDRDNISDRMGPNNIVMGWTPDGKSIIYRSRWYSFSPMRGLLYKISAEGGIPEQIPTSEGGFCSYSPDGKYLAMNRMFREFRTWKYYAGGQADEIWINKVGTTSIEKITDNSNQDIFPMWIGDEIFYISDRDRIMNLFVYNTKNKKTEKVTDFKEYDIKFPAASKDYIVFENGGYIYKFSIKNRSCEKVEIQLYNDNIYARSKFADASNKMFAFSLSPDAERILVVARGEIFSLPATKGPTYNITRTPSAHEREAMWSPDGKMIAYFSDANGEYQVFTAPSNNMNDAIQMTSFADGYPTKLTWSPDSKFLYFGTEKRDIYSLNVQTKELKRILVSETFGFGAFNLSPDGEWIAYTAAGMNKVSIVYLYEVKTGKSYAVTDKWYDSSSPMFSEDGKYLFFTSSRDFHSTYSRVEWNASYDVSDYVFIVPLAKGTEDPTSFKSDEYNPDAVVESKDEIKVAPGEKLPSNKEKAEPKQVNKDVKKGDGKPAVVTEVDIDGIEQRISVLPLEPGRYRLYLATGNKLYYSSFRGGGNFIPVGPRGAAGNGMAVKALDLKTMKSSDAIQGSPVAFAMKSNKVLVRDKGEYFVIPLAGGRPGSDLQPVPTSDMDVLVECDKEWKQIFDESWRITRDYFYVKNMNGTDWNKIYEKYSKLLPYVKHRHDLTYIIGEMLGELNVGHAYITSGEAPEAPRLKVGLLGAKFSKDKSGVYKIEKIFKGANWSEQLRSPLTESGINVEVGDYIISVNGVPCSELSDIYEALVGKVDKVVALEISSKANGKNARKVYVKPISDETSLAYYEWVQGNIAKVEKASNGEIGYIHIPDMGTEGLDAFTKLFYTQLDKKALIIDDRMNGGGNVSPMILERLQREVYRMSMFRNGMNEPVPNESHYGPKVCLIDKYSMSDGDLFPYGFKKLGLGKVIGMRSWGGIVGISGSKSFIDGQDMRTPFFTSYSSDTGDWIIEGYGVDPDIVIDINPFEDFLGNDAQLDKAIEVLKEDLKNYKLLPGTPADPVK